MGLEETFGVPFLLCSNLVIVSVQADQTAITNFNAAKTVFWNDLYPTGDHTLYCDQSFSGHSGLDDEHVYAASWMGDHLACGNRAECRAHATHSTRFNHMEADRNGQRRTGRNIGCGRYRSLQLSLGQPPD